MPPLNNPSLRTRSLTPADAALLASLPCTCADPVVEQFIREDLGHAATHGAHPLGMFRNGELVAVACHRENQRLADMGGNVIAGTELELIAIVDSHRDTDLLPQVIEAIREDIAARNRGHHVAIYVHPDNPDGLKLAIRFEAIQDGPSGDDIAWLTNLDRLR